MSTFEVLAIMLRTLALLAFIIRLSITSDSLDVWVVVITSIATGYDLHRYLLE